MRFNIFFWIRVKLWDRLWRSIVHWLNHEKDDFEIPPSDFKQLCYEIRPGDVILVEGRSRVPGPIPLCILAILMNLKIMNYARRSNIIMMAILIHLLLLKHCLVKAL